MQPDVGVGVQAEAARDPLDQGIAVMRDDPEVVPGLVVHVVGQGELDVADRVAGHSVQRAGQFAADQHGHRPRVEGGHERALPVAGNELDPVARLGGCADRLADVHAERCADGGPQLGAPVLELAVEVAGGVTDAPVVQPPRTERRHPLVDEGRQLLEGVGPFPVAAAEHGVGDAGQVGLVPGQPPGELDRVIRRGSVAGGGGDGDGTVAEQGVHVVVQRGQAGAEAAARPLGGELPGDLLGGAEVGSVQDQQRGAVIGPLRGRPRDGLRGLAWCRGGESGCEHYALQWRNRRELGREVVDAVHEALNVNPSRSADASSFDCSWWRKSGPGAW